MTQPEALRLADDLLKYLGGNTATKAAAELRRLHEDYENALKHFAEAIDGYKQMAAQRDELLEALRALMALDVKGHALADRLQFSDAGRALLHQCQAAIEKAEQETT